VDSLINAAARMLSAGDPIAALKLVALRNDAPGLALRGIAMAQLGEYPRARALLRKAARGFPPEEAVARARCLVAESEVALVSRDLRFAEKSLDAARATLQAHGDGLNSAHALYLHIRRLLLLGKLEDAERALARATPSISPALNVTHELIVGGIAMRRLRATRAREAFARAMTAARVAGIPALNAEVEAAQKVLDAPAARLVGREGERLLSLEDVEKLFSSSALIVDGCRYAVRRGRRVISLATRPVLMTLARALAEAWPGDVARDELVTRAFRLKLDDESHRARLRVEIGRLRKLLRGIATVEASRRGFALEAAAAREVIALAPPVEEKHAAVLALMADGDSWSSSALAQALDASQRTVQRSLDALALLGKVHACGGGRSRRWMTPPVPGFTTMLLLPATLPTD
jgi:tetratricopeptide (TPR) repeat protein